MNNGVEVQGLQQPPPISPPPFASPAFRKLVRGMAREHRARMKGHRAALREARRDLAIARFGERAERQRLAKLRGVMRLERRAALNIRRAEGLIRRERLAKLRELRAGNRALRQQLRALNAWSSGRGSRLGRGGRGRRRGMSFLPWVVRKLLRAFRSRSVGDGRNHGYTGVRKRGRTGRGGR